jgi:acetate kinase
MGADRVLVVNAGSSSLKLSVLDGQDRLLSSQDMEGRPQDRDLRELRAAMAAMGPVEAVGHRVVHGGSEFIQATLIDPAVTTRLERLTGLDPLHLPGASAGMRAAQMAYPDLPQVACFDTAFHAGMPPAAATYALPQSWRQRWGLRRYGFHGLSYGYATRRAAELLAKPVEQLRLVICHLGAGASAAAVSRGHSVDTTMGFTPLEGLVMATRSGSVDPGLIIWLEREQGLSPGDIGDGLEQDSGLLGLAGTADMKAVVDAATRAEPEATLALEVYVHRLRQAIAAMTASLGGLDALVFTGGVGEGSALVRDRTVSGLGFLGLSLDRESNVNSVGDRHLEGSTSSVAVLVLEAREDLQIAFEVRRLLS